MLSVLSCKDRYSYSETCNIAYLVDDSNLIVDSVFAVRMNFQEDVWVTKRYFPDDKITNINCIDSIVQSKGVMKIRFIGTVKAKGRRNFLLSERTFNILIPPLP